MNVQMVCLADQYISHVNAKFAGSVHDAYILRNSSIPYVMGQLQRHRVWLLDHRGLLYASQLGLRQQVPFLPKDGPAGGVVAAVEPVDSEEEEPEEEDIDNRNTMVHQYFRAAVCTANGIPRLKDLCVDSWVVIAWAYFCWRDGGGFVFASLSLTFGVGGTGTQGNWEGCLRQGADRPREPTLHEALSSIMGAYHHSQETMAMVLAKFQETQRLQEEQYLGFREELRTISSVLSTIVGVLKDIQNTMGDTMALQGAPDTSLDDELPTTSAGASGQDAPPQDHHTSTPPPAPLQMDNHPASGP
ncbi:hypothetical protein NDU88_003690 [Pleurodeles waltl]|uniref:Uncharacterized protein n=1 Tax=Pleurodeles waltl TaxID=8319 RepID=A0AAV7VEX1_PLEWA|nr:hypothetical protein NDU88_003690 [Pleurodeles waltl]